ncbi:MAG TPA: DUF4860 domain-containing protein [Candidatus Limiplasma sp.]|nr:DUF4860 domain-containing protein [Candidatus Limiplasma sp.]
MRTQRFESNNLRTAGSLLTFVLVCMFALLSVLIVAIGIQAYDQIMQNTQANTQLRTSLSYTVNKIRAHDGLGAIEAKQEGDSDTLALYQTIEGEGYVTYIYCYDGMLYEWFTAAGTAFDPKQGEPLVELQSFSAVVGKSGVQLLYTDTEGVAHTQFTATFSE